MWIHPNTRQSPAWGSTPQHPCSKKAQRKANGRKLFGSEIVHSFARNLQSGSGWSFFLPLFLVSFLSFCRTFSCGGKHHSPAVQEQHQFAQGASGKHGPACTVRKKESVSSPNNASASKGVPFWRRTLFVIMATNPAKLSFARCWSGRLPEPGKSEVSSS